MLTIAISVNRASLDFGNRTPAPSGTATPAATPSTTGGQAKSGVTVDLIGLQGTFDLAVDALGILLAATSTSPRPASGPSGSPRSRPRCPDVAQLTATGVSFGYDPGHKAEDGPQELLRIATASITFPSLGVTGSLRPYDPTHQAERQRPDRRRPPAAPVSCPA